MDIGKFIKDNNLSTVNIKLAKYKQGYKKKGINKSFKLFIGDKCTFGKSTKDRVTLKNSFICPKREEEVFRSMDIKILNAKVEGKEYILETNNSIITFTKAAN